MTHAGTYTGRPQAAAQRLGLLTPRDSRVLTLRSRLQFVRHRFQLAKAHAPARQGLLYGTHHSAVMVQLNMDLIGPITVGVKTHASDDNPSYILTITDPFSHMVWLEVINRKTAQAVYQKVVERILLEEGCPRVILTDNGTEFKNDLLKGLVWQVANWINEARSFRSAVPRRVRTARALHRVRAL